MAGRTPSAGGQRRPSQPGWGGAGRPSAPPTAAPRTGRALLGPFSPAKSPAKHAVHKRLAPALDAQQPRFKPPRRRSATWLLTGKAGYTHSPPILLFHQLHLLARTTAPYSPRASSDALPCRARPLHNSRATASSSTTSWAAARGREGLWGL